MNLAEAGAPLRVGVLGAGQLGRMLGLAALRLGVAIRFLTPRDSGATAGVGELMVGEWRDPQVLREFARGCTVITAEAEWAPLAELERVLAELEAAGEVPPRCWPRAQTMALIRDKLVQKRTLVDAGLAVGEFRGCASLAEAEAAARGFGWPVLVKRRRGAYDGYGNRRADDLEQLRAAWEALAEAPEEDSGFEGGVLIEAWVPFVRELAVSVARGPEGESAVYPVVHTEQDDHRCAAVVAPAPIAASVAEAARALAQAAVERFEVVGVCAVELFELADGRLLVNELAPRPHNSAHYSIEACASSQFENHLRATLGWPLGDPSLVVPAALMLNLLGSRAGPTRVEGLADALAVPGVALHLYAKRESRPGRKMGHLTVLGEDIDELRERAERAAGRITL
ncbi:5-(carboxyamino)imidazole ribonucleotide synthase [Pseudenhygromyxa sp. WMMC2535]|uniref:5-(carboxyamino)imidazole ribonucleotide synthase n=1 Tax=Pseudenhygromyxa sp. WMMC2535 TaxID=2712867 RepID=UPI0015565528|nr:5-(carboxyamino)imidazole ribonucleotide synthase [Pseudenhygromyxa sp. WMMC2535]NVB39720.1 5-(carboxyamino)imidazole ribonucleotide synthase [Pseudenhygromyxa sp. WMMC2535]